MFFKLSVLALSLALLVVLPASAELVKGIMGIKGAEMN